tara:strand:- start:1108 stop:2304 length:1197 start_codon:yes stop_codon:yes gene_type:complete
MEKFELLDRFELLYPHLEKLSELRRLYIDKDLSSLFKITNADEELRKAVMEQNLHSVFRLVDDKYEDLRKAVVEKNWRSIFRLIPDTESVTNGTVDDLRTAVVEENLNGLFRLLGPDHEDLRKAVVEENIHSIFRCMPDVNEDLQKAVTEQNIYSIFRLIDDEDLRKLVTEDNDWKLWPVLERYTDTQFVAAFKNFFVNKTDIWDDCFSRGQLQSKSWLVRELKELDPKLGTVFLCAGWYATLATMLFENDFEIDCIRSFDIDPSCVEIAEVFNKPWFVDNWKFKAITDDIKNINYFGHQWQMWSNKNNRLSNPISDTPDTIINTSCEHIDNFAEWYDKIPYDKLVILQSNNYFEIEEHVNCSKDIDEFKAQAPCKEYLFTGTLDLGIYKRFMIIGKK